MYEINAKVMEERNWGLQENLKGHVTFSTTIQN